jgi:hypothetical protein
MDIEIKQLLFKNLMEFAFKTLTEQQYTDLDLHLADYHYSGLTAILDIHDRPHDIWIQSYLYSTKEIQVIIITGGVSYWLK